jgi:uncharacterized protein (DUF952 family)
MEVDYRPKVKTIYKIVPAALWSEAMREGVFAGSPVDLADGFIHFSTRNQVRETASRHFAGQSGLLLVAVDVDRLPVPLKWEPSRGGDLFPHLYGPLPVDAAIWIEPLPIDADGLHIWPEMPDDKS